MGSRWENLVVDAHDPARLARWWAAALGYAVLREQPDEVRIGPGPDRLPGLVFVAVPQAKAGKNRLHVDLRPDDQEAEVERLVDMGARHVDVGPSGAAGWVVLADPEGNEFCVLTPVPAGAPQAADRAGRTDGTPSRARPGGRLDLPRQVDAAQVDAGARPDAAAEQRRSTR